MDGTSAPSVVGSRDGGNFLQETVVIESVDGDALGETMRGEAVRGSHHGAKRSEARSSGAPVENDIKAALAAAAGEPARGQEGETIQGSGSELPSTIDDVDVSMVQASQIMRIVFTLWASGNRYWREEERRRAISRAGPDMTAEQLAVLKVAQRHFRLRRMYQGLKDWELIVFGVTNHAGGDKPRRKELLQARKAMQRARRGSFTSDASDDSLFSGIPTATPSKKKGRSRAQAGSGGGCNDFFGFAGLACCDGDRGSKHSKKAKVPKPRRTNQSPGGSHQERGKSKGKRQKHPPPATVDAASCAVQ